MAIAESKPADYPEAASEKQ